MSCKKLQEVTEALLGLYAPCFDIARPFAVGKVVYGGYAFCNVTSSRYVLVQKAELWRAYTFEHVFFREMDVFSGADLRGYERQLQEEIEPGFVRRGERYPQPDHMCTYITGIFICRGAVSGDVRRQIRRHRFHLNYRFALRGYCESRLLVFDLQEGRICGNRAAKPLVKEYRHMVGGQQQ